MSKKNTQLRTTYDQVMVPTYSPPQIIPDRGNGSRIWDQHNQEFIDFAGGIAVSCLGHCHPELVNTIQQQSQKLWHLSNVMTNEPAIQLAQQLTAATFADQVYFANSGAEANEAALKLARRYAIETYGPDKTQIIAFKQGFHGRTFFTVSVGGQAKYSDNFGPKPADIDHASFNDIASVEALISDKTCAVIIEPIQGEGGIIPADPKFLQQLRQLCDQHNALLIFDEIQTGVGRTGHLYAYMGYQVTPDILTSAKALGAGFPIAAMLTTKQIASHLNMGTHGSTYGGNPMACAVGNKVLELVNTEAVLAGVTERSNRLISGLNTINKRYPFLETIRGQGLLLGIVLNSQWQGKSREFLMASIQQQLMILVAGLDVVRFAPSLIIPHIDIDEGLDRFEQVVKTLTT